MADACFGQTLRVRILSPKDGQRLAKQEVSLSLLYYRGERTPVKYDAVVRLQTDVRGEAQFLLPQPYPSHFSVQATLSGPWRCGCSAFGSTEDLLQKGVTIDLAHELGTSDAMRAGPGEVVFVARPLTFFEKLLWPFVKQ